MADRPVDERAPLLDREAQVEAGEALPTPKKERTWWTIGWNIVWTVLGVFVLAVFIKGFIDADDVDVSLTCFFGGMVPARKLPWSSSGGRFRWRDTTTEARCRAVLSGSVCGDLLNAPNLLQRDLLYQYYAL